MKRWFRYLGFSLLALLGLLLIGLILAAWLIDPNVYKSTLADFASRQVGRPVKLEGDLALAWFPRLGLNVAQASLGNPPGFGDAPFAKVEQAQITLAWWPLLQGRIEAGALVLHGAEITLIRREDGAENWRDFPSTGSGNATEEPLPEPVEGNGDPLAKLALEALEIEDATVNWQDAGAAYRLSEVSLRAGPVRAGQPVNLKLAATAQGQPFTLETALELDIPGQRYRLEDSTLALQLGEIGAQLRLTGLEWADQALGLTGLEARATDFSLAVPQAGLAGGKLSLPAFTLDGPALALRGQIEANLAEFHLQAELSGEIQQLRETLARIGVNLPATADPAVLQRLSFQASLAGGFNQLKIQPLHLTLDDTALEGEAEWGALPVFTLRADRLNLDRYLPPATSEPAKPGALPLETLRGLGLRGSLQVNKLETRGVIMENAVLEVK